MTATLHRLGTKALQRALLLTLAVTGLLATAGATPAAAQACTGIHYYADAYVGSWRTYGPYNVTMLEETGMGTLTQLQKRWRDRKGYKTCTASTGRRYHLHYRGYGEDARTRTCYHALYWPIGCGSWTNWPWRVVSPGVVYTHWHWL